MHSILIIDRESTVLHALTMKEQGKKQGQQPGRRGVKMRGRRQNRGIGRRSQDCRVSDEIRATILDHVLNHERMAKAGLFKR